MIITFFKEHGTLMMTDMKGKCIAEGGDDKMLCPNDQIAQYIVDAVTYVTGTKFFRYDEGDLVQWKSLLSS